MNSFGSMTNKWPEIMPLPSQQLYIDNQIRKENNFISNNSGSPPHGTVEACNAYQAKSSLNGGMVEKFINDPTEDNLSLLDMKSRPVSDFIHNNMVPFYGSNVRQNMAGTGVQSGNYTDGKDVDSGFANESPFLDKLQTFTGLDSTYLHKRETGPHFSPAEQQTGWVTGMPLVREDEDRFTMSLTKRHDLAPTEKIMVGPGIDLDPSIPASGGYHDFARVLPNNVNDYKMHQLEGRVISQGFQLGGQQPTAMPGVGISDQQPYGVPNNKPTRFWAQPRLPTMTTKASSAITGDELRPNYDASFRPNNASRNQINYGYGTVTEKRYDLPYDQGSPGAYNGVSMNQLWK